MMCVRDGFFALTEDINTYANLYKRNEGALWLGTGARWCSIRRRVLDGELSGAGLLSVLLLLDLEVS